MEKLLRYLFPFFLLFPFLAAGCLQKPYYPGKDYGELRSACTWRRRPPPWRRGGEPPVLQDSPVP